ncbi:hypothetical protein [Streptomyces flavofungini]|uniref:Secreted protein n=1 Tax=Streptomyces flavofungini TaxID=68200 RepID=A0ABS0XCQ4_9ACTN|nr:hypothetical protein [Streptomyces flavofungini]MBJ3810989.1 hypothetical protein [Streptomyces flavofungini]GHC40993.1 hypothetical protein GCM10010349_00840 [Streptomyces flavofungini]
MRRSTIFIPASTLTIAAGITGLVLWLNHSSYEDRVENCAQALEKQHAEGGEGRPDPCDRVKKNDYTALVADAEGPQP